MIRDSEEARATWSERSPWGLREIIQAAGVLLAGLVFIGATGGLVAAAADVDLSDAQVTGVGLIATIAVDITLFALAAGFSIGKYRRGWGGLGLGRPAVSHLWVVLGTVVGVFALVAVYGVIINVLGLDDLIPESTLQEDIFDNRALVLLAGSLAVITAPVAEETFFRGFLFGGLVRRLGFFWSALASGFLFSLLHAQVGVLIPFTIVGMAFAWAYAYTGSLWTSIGSHLLYNGIIFTVSLGGWE